MYIEEPSKHIIREVRLKLDNHGREDVDIFVSGGLDPEDIRNLWPYVDGVGIGGYVSNADPVDFGLDIVVRDGEAVTKRGKLPGLKRVAYENGEQVIEPATEPDAGRFERRVADGEVLSVEYGRRRTHDASAGHCGT